MDKTTGVASAVGKDPAKRLVFELEIETALHEHRRGRLTYERWRSDRQEP